MTSLCICYVKATIPMYFLSAALGWELIYLSAGRPCSPKPQCALKGGRPLASSTTGPCSNIAAPGYCLDGPLSASLPRWCANAFRYTPLHELARSTCDCKAMCRGGDCWQHRQKACPEGRYHAGGGIMHLLHSCKAIKPCNSAGGVCHWKHCLPLHAQT
jgi:hypothetical protein